ncbi:hypothetical protein SNE40_013293 [Patella caerulea]|uniref:Magnesium-dependent phosphatase 1 n=1 Tax=Patella caerulea TaxID=87958 RepID=A0AAN8PXD4_PATCE
MAQQMKPKIIVFDLDYTLWPFWVDTHVSPPFNKHKDGKVYDQDQQLIKYYTDVPGMLHKLHNDGYTLGVASRTDTPPEAHKLMELFDWDKYFRYKEVYPGNKINHFQQFQSKSGIPYKDMLFFDDEIRNIVDVDKLGVTCIHAADGMSNAVLTEGLQKFQMNNC